MLSASASPLIAAARLVQKRVALRQPCPTRRCVVADQPARRRLGEKGKERWNAGRSGGFGAGGVGDAEAGGGEGAARWGGGGWVGWVKTHRSAGRHRRYGGLSPTLPQTFDLRQALAGQHVVFFREDDAAVTVVRVLHQRMDVGRV